MLVFSYMLMYVYVSKYVMSLHMVRQISEVVTQILLVGNMTGQ